MSRGFVDRDRKTEYLSAKIFGDDRIRKVKSYCRLNNMNIRFFLEELIDAFFKNKENELMSLSKEELVKMILEELIDAFFKNKENELMSLSKEELVKMILEKEADNK